MWGCGAALCSGSAPHWQSSPMPCQHEGGITETRGLEKSFKILRSSHHPDPLNPTTKAHPLVPCPPITKIHPGMGTPVPMLWALSP